MASCHECSLFHVMYNDMQPGPSHHYLVTATNACCCLQPCRAMHSEYKRLKALGHLDAVKPPNTRELLQRILFKLECANRPQQALGYTCMPMRVPLTTAEELEAVQAQQLDLLVAAAEQEAAAAGGTGDLLGEYGFNTTSCTQQSSCLYCYALHLRFMLTTRLRTMWTVFTSLLVVGLRMLMSLLQLELS